MNKTFSEYYAEIHTPDYMLDEPERKKSKVKNPDYEPAKPDKHSFVKNTLTDKIKIEKVLQSPEYKKIEPWFKKNVEIKNSTFGYSVFADGLKEKIAPELITAYLYSKGYTSDLKPNFVLSDVKKRIWQFRVNAKKIN